MARPKAKKTFDERREDEANEMLARAMRVGYLVLDGRGRADVVFRRNEWFARPRWDRHCLEAHRPDVTLRIGCRNPRTTFRASLEAEYGHLGAIAPHNRLEMARRLLSVSGCEGAHVWFNGPMTQDGFERDDHAGQVQPSPQRRLIHRPLVLARSIPDHAAHEFCSLLIDLILDYAR